MTGIWVTMLRPSSKQCSRLQPTTCAEFAPTARDARRSDPGERSRTSLSGSSFPSPREREGVRDAPDAEAGTPTGAALERRGDEVVVGSGEDGDQ